MLEMKGFVVLVSALAVVHPLLQYQLRRPLGHGSWLRTNDICESLAVGNPAVWSVFIILGAACHLQTVHPERIR